MSEPDSTNKLLTLAIMVTLSKLTKKELMLLVVELMNENMHKIGRKKKEKVL